MEEIPEMTTVHESQKTATVGPTVSEIAALAYQLWLDKGCPTGSDQEDWFRAEEVLQNPAMEEYKDLVGRSSIPTDNLGIESEILAELACKGLQGHWEVWEREWVGARWVCDVPLTAGVSSYTRMSTFK